MTKIEVKAVIEIPEFTFLGVRSAAEVGVLVPLEDVCAHLTRTAAAFDEGGANADIALVLRAVRDGFLEAETRQV